MKVCIIGLGQVGLPTASYIAKHGFEVCGYDIRESAVNNAKGVGIEATTHWHKVPPADVYVICVNTSLVNNRPDMTSIVDVCEKIAQKTRSSLVSIESTIVPGTCRKIHEYILGGDAPLIHVPHRYWSGDPLEHGVKQARVIGAVNEKSLERGLWLYRDQLEIPLYVTSSVEVAEMSKIAENAYRYVQIAFAEELKLICEDLGINFEDTRKACNTKWNIEILEARKGIKGQCLPKDIRYLASIGKHNALIEGAMLLDDTYKRFLAQKKKAAIEAPKYKMLGITKAPEK